MRGSVAEIGGLLAGLLRGAGAPTDGEAALQDSLDLVALVVGEKKVALVGCGYAAGPWLDDIAELASPHGLTLRRGGMPWIVAADLEGLPDWYGAPICDSWRGADLLTVARPPHLPSRSGTPAPIGLAEEADLLGYPLCCVTDHHARRRRFHELMVELVAAARGTDAERRRLVAAELLPPVRDASDRRRLAEALRSTPLPFTSLAICQACEAQRPGGPAGKMAARYHALARASGLEPLFAHATEREAAEV